MLVPETPDKAEDEVRLAPAMLFLLTRTSFLIVFCRPVVMVAVLFGLPDENGIASQDAEALCRRAFE